MQLDRLTTKAQEAVQEAQQIAHRHANQEVDTEHLLAALLAQPESRTRPLLEKLSVSVPDLSAEVDKELARKVKVQGISSTGRYLGSNLKKALDNGSADIRQIK